MQCATPRLMISASGSGAGKTTITCAILKLLVEKKYATIAFKCGPDYIDPMFHSTVSGAPCHNLDTFLMTEDQCRTLFAERSQGMDIAVVEGVMGYYDGISDSADGSTYHMAKTLKAPVLLVVNCKGMALSISALIKGFSEFMPESRIQGILLNGIKSEMYQFYKTIIETNTGIKVYGYLPNLEKYHLDSRHLGLVTPYEIKDFHRKAEMLAQTILETVDIEGLVELARTAEPLEYHPSEFHKVADVKIAIAQDRAFNFYYEDSLSVLERMGAELIPFSPLEDKPLPDGISGVYIGGGYPELFGETLAGNEIMLDSLRKVIDDGMPVFAECGGFMLLCRGVANNQGFYSSLTGIVKSDCEMTNRLQRFGYITMTAQRDNILCKKGHVCNGHEFHYSDSTDNGNGFIAVKPYSKRTWECIHLTDNLFAGFPHFHFRGNPDMAESFIRHCDRYQKKQG